jgi:dihydrofolate synthase/folylpolyglutamate synthase
VKPGLERISGLLDVLADPHRGYPIVHVAGSNGKTSTSRMAAAICGAHGLVAGLFTSPHLQSVAERYEVGGEVMRPEEFAGMIEEIGPLVELWEQRSGDPVTYFEVTTALAFAWFAERAVDVAVVETGLGGRLDASNAADATVAVITTIGLEHTQYLGDTLGAIAGEKAAILPEGGTLVTGRLADEAAAVVARRVADQRAAWLRLGEDFRVGEAVQAVGGWLTTVEGIYDTYEDLPLHVHGRHQLDNLAVSLGAVEALLGRGLDRDAVVEATAGIVLPGRMEIARRHPVVMLDGAHNPQGVDGLASALAEEFPTTGWRLVFGVMADKDIASMVETLAPVATAVHTVAAADSERALPSAEVAAAFEGLVDGPIEAHDSVAEAVAAAIGGDDPVLVTGSLYVVGEARDALGLGYPG